MGDAGNDRGISPKNRCVIRSVYFPFYPDAPFPVLWTAGKYFCFFLSRYRSKDHSRQWISGIKLGFSGRNLTEFRLLPGSRQFCVMLQITPAVSCI